MSVARALRCASNRALTRARIARAHVDTQRRGGAKEPSAHGPPAKPVPPELLHRKHKALAHVDSLLRDAERDFRQRKSDLEFERDALTRIVGEMGGWRRAARGGVLRCTA